MTKHIHAELMMEYAKDAMETDKPWARWQFRKKGDTEWSNFVDDIIYPSWISTNEYRRKIKTVNINGFEVPEPLTVEPKLGELIYIICFGYYGSDVIFRYWKNDEYESMTFNCRLCHKTKEAAEIHAKALLSFFVK